MKNFEWVLIGSFLISGIAGVIMGLIYSDSNMGWRGGIMMVVGSLYARVKNLEDKQ